MLSKVSEVKDDVGCDLGGLECEPDAPGEVDCAIRLDSVGPETCNHDVHVAGNYCDATCVSFSLCNVERVVTVLNWRQVLVITVEEVKEGVLYLGKLATIFGLLVGICEPREEQVFIELRKDWVQCAASRSVCRGTWMNLDSFSPRRPFTL